MFGAGIAITDAGIRHVMQGEASLNLIVEAIGQFDAGTELDYMAEITSVAAIGIETDRGIGHDDEVIIDHKLKTETDIAIGAAVSTDITADKGCDTEVEAVIVSIAQITVAGTVFDVEQDGFLPSPSARTGALP